MSIIIKYIVYLIIGATVFWLTEIITVKLGKILGTGPYGLDLVVYAIAVLCSVITICTLANLDALGKFSSQKSD